MDISITGLTENPRFVKALVRASGALAGLRMSCKDIDSSSEVFDVLQIVFVDQPVQHVALHGTKRGDRLFQVDVGMGVDQSFARDEDAMLLRMIAQQVLRAVRETPFTDNCRDAVIERIDEWWQTIDGSVPVR